MLSAKSKSLENVSVTISRPSSSRHDGDMIRVALYDEDSRIRFVEFEVSPENMMLALTGLSSLKVDKCEVGDFEKVGLVRVSEPRRYKLTKEERDAITLKSAYSRGAYEQWLIENKQEEGWYVDSYLGSQGSIGYDPDTPHLITGYTNTLKRTKMFELFLIIIASMIGIAAFLLTLSMWAVLFIPVVTIVACAAVVCVVAFVCMAAWEELVRWFRRRRIAKLAK